MRKMIVIFCLLLLACQPVSANSVEILGAGKVELGQDFVVTEVRDKNGDINYSFRVKDGEVWRGAMLMPIKDMTAKEANIIKMDVLLNQIIEGNISKMNDVLSTEKARQMMVGENTYTTASMKFGIPGGGIVANMDMTIISGANGLKLFTYICADGDSQYWKPVMQKILISCL